MKALTAVVVAAVLLTTSPGIEPAQAAPYGGAYPVAGLAFEPEWLTLGADGAIWFGGTDEQVGRIDRNGAPTLHEGMQHRISGARDPGLVVGPDGLLWGEHCEDVPLEGTHCGLAGWSYDGELVVPPEIDPSTAFTEHRWDGVFWSDADGTIWGTAYKWNDPAQRFDHFLGRRAPNGDVTYVPLTGVLADGGNDIFGATTDRLGRFWLRLRAGTFNGLQWIDRNGRTGTVPLQYGAHDVIAGPDGNLWFSTGPHDRIGRLTMDGRVTYFPLPGPPEIGSYQSPLAIAAGADGNVWFATANAHRLGRITRTGQITMFGSQLIGVSNLLTGADGRLWFTRGMVPADRSVGAIDLDLLLRSECLPLRFVDVSASVSSTFCEDIMWLAENGISTGTPGGNHFLPNQAVSRQAMAAFMYRLAGSPAFADPATSSFGDVGTGHPFFTEIEWLAAEGISTGTPASPKPLFKPDAPVTRDAMSAFLYRLAGSPAFTPPAAPQRTFGDVSAQHPFFTEIEWLAAEGISTGTPASPKPLFKPAASVTRAAMSAFMHRLADGPGVGVTG